MAGKQISETVVERVMKLESSKLRIEVLPEVGGKISQIALKPDEKQLLIPPQKPYVTIPPGGSWMDYDMSGMDDCFPIIASGIYPCDPWKGTEFRPLGEWVYGRWEVIAPAKEGRILMRRRGERLPYLAFKTVSLSADDTLRLDYKVENHGGCSLRYIWALHPLIQVGEAFRLNLAAGEKEFRVYPGKPEFQVWPSYGSIDLSREWIPEGKTLKIFVAGIEEGRCDLLLDSCAIRFLYDTAKQPVLGIWFNNLGFPPGSQSPFRCIAVEPCSAASDELDELEPGRYLSIPGHGAVSWSVELKIERRTGSEP